MFFTRSISCCEMVGTTTPIATPVNVIIKRYSSKIAKPLGTFLFSKKTNNGLNMKYKNNAIKIGKNNVDMKIPIG